MQLSRGTDTPSQDRPPRDDTLDVLRGGAIAVMVLGHLAIEIVVPPGAFYIEAIGGLAPALFLTISGMLVAYAAWRKGPSPRRSLIRGAELLAVAALLDVFVWRIRPFTTVDILYLIALSLPVAHVVATRTPPPVRWTLAAAFLLLAPVLQAWLGYSDYPTEYLLDGELVEEIDLPGIGDVPIDNQTNVLQHWVVDGWFPLFPWLGYSLLGVAWGGLRWQISGTPGFRWVAGLLPGIALTAVGLALGWLDVDYELTPRRRYGGAFMPPDYGYLIGSVGFIGVLLFLVDLRPRWSAFRPIALLGRHSLLVYLVHFPAILVIARVLDERVPHAVYLAIYAGLLAGLTAVAAGVEWARGRRRAAAPAST